MPQFCFLGGVLNVSVNQSSAYYPHASHAVCIKNMALRLDSQDPRHLILLFAAPHHALSHQKHMTSLEGPRDQPKWHDLDTKAPV